MENLPKCTNCQENFTYLDNNIYICPMCSHEWETQTNDDVEEQFLDSNGNTLLNGDTIILIKDLKIKGTSLTIKQGTKVKNIQLVAGDHNIDCRVDGIGKLKLKSEFVKKS